jgi:hypothetical protein
VRLKTLPIDGLAALNELVWHELWALASLICTSARWGWESLQIPGAVLPAMNNAWSSSNRARLAHEIVQQPVNPFRSKSAKVLEMPDFIGCL